MDEWIDGWTSPIIKNAETDLEFSFKTLEITEMIN